MPPRRTPRTNAGKSTPKPKNSSKSLQSTALPTTENAPETPTPSSSTTTTTAAVTEPLSSPSLPNAEKVSEEAQPTIVPLEADPNGGAVTPTQTLNEAGVAEKPSRRTVVRRTVKVVRKILKKKVRKESEIGTSVSLNGAVESLELGNKVSPKLSGLLVVEPNCFDSADNLKPDSTICKEIDYSEPIVTDSVGPEYQSPDPSDILSMEAAKPSDVLMETENQKDFDGGEGGQDGCLFEQVSAVALIGVAANFGGDEVEDTVGANAALLEDDEILAEYQQDKGITGDGNSEGSTGKVGEMEHSMKESECSELILDEGKKEDVNDEINVCDERQNEQVCDGEVGGSEVEIGLRDGVLLSGEMESIERRKRRKTEIFIGGLGKEATEEDVRKVFEVVGEIMDVTVVKDSKTGKGKGFAFVRYASAEDAKIALAKYHKVEICGRQYGTSLVEGNDTIFLGNIDKRWKNEDVFKHLQEIDIEKIDRVTVKTDPNNLELNRGFAFLEFETKKDAQTAFHKLQKKDAFGKHTKIKIEWAEPLIEPDEEEILKVKSVYAEYLPSSWDEEKVKDYFKCFGEIENVARNFRSSKRKDFAFINYKTREAALACIEGFSRDRYDEGSKVNVKVSLAKSTPRGKQVKHVSKPPNMEVPKEKHNTTVAVLAPHERRNMGKSFGTRSKDTRADGKSSNDELLQLLREQASWKPTATSSIIDQDYLQPTPGWKRSSTVLGNEFYSDPRGYPRMRMGSSYPVANPSSRPLQGVGIVSLPGYTGYKQYGANYPAEALYRVEEDPTYSQTREQAPYHDNSALYRRY